LHRKQFYKIATT